MRITARDIAMLTWLTQLQCGTYEHLAQVTGTSVGAIRRRLPGLEKLGLVSRVDARRGDRPIAQWFPTPRGAAMTTTRISPAHPSKVDIGRAGLLADIALRHRYNGRQLLAGIEVETTLARAALQYGLKGSEPFRGSPPSPDLLIQDGDNCLTAIELRLGNDAALDWHQRLLDYDCLGVQQLLLCTDSVPLNACLGSPGAYAARILVTVQLLRD